MDVVELWSAGEERRAKAMVEASDADELAEALFALEGATGEAAESARNTLAALAEEVGRAEKGPDGGAVALTSVLRQAGFAGDVADYHAVSNSHLTSVVARRRGMPILLSCVWMIVGRGASLRVDGIGLPGHFIVRVGGDAGTLVDPFHGGALLDVAACRRLVRAATGHDVPWDDRFLRAYRTRDVLERVLRNLSASHERAGGHLAQHRVASLWCALHPDAAPPWMTRAETAERLGARSDARLAYEEILRRFPGSTEAATAEARLLRLPAVIALN